MKLYQSSASPNSRRVRIFLAEKGISMPLVPVDLGAKEQFSEAYAAINPRGVVPVLVLDDGTAIGECRSSCAISKKSFPSRRCSARRRRQERGRRCGSAASNWKDLPP